MTSEPLIEKATVRLDADLGSSKDEVIRALADTLVDAGRATDTEALLTALLAREEKAATGMKGGFAIPHCKSAAVNRPSLAFARLEPPVDFGAEDGPADLVFMLGAPDGEGKAHLKMLSKLARSLVKKDFVASLRAAKSDDEAVDLILGAIEDKPKATEGSAVDGAGSAAGAATAGTAATGAAAAGTAGSAAAGAEATDDASANGGDSPVRIVAVTSCATGIAHTYMAADSLEQAAKEKGLVFAVEPQGSSGTTPLSSQQIAEADAVVFATDVGVRDRSRFAGKPVVEGPVKRGIDHPNEMLDAAVAAAKDPNATRVSGSASAEDGTAAGAAGGSGGEHWARTLQRGVMNGVSYMIPFVAAGGLLLALGFLFGEYDMANVYSEIVTNFSLWDLPGHLYQLDGSLVGQGTQGAEELRRTGFLLYFGAVLFAIGQAAMAFMIPVLSGYIAMGIADRPGLAPGFVGGAISLTLDAGFLGALITGILAGFLMRWMSTWTVPSWMRGLMPVVLFPLLGSIVIGLLMFLVLGRPIAWLMETLTDALSSMSGSSAVILGLVLGLMMCFDLGGPVNKAAYVFATTGLNPDEPATLKIMAAVMAAGMVPPIALSVATFARKRLFTPAERENGRAAWLLGLSFISEGAIPFAAADPLRVIPAMMLGGATTGALSMAFSVESYAPHGGVFVFFAISPFVMYLLAILAGVAVSTVAVVVAKSIGKRAETVEKAEIAAERAQAPVA
ncbi:PTS fructose transporter subunit IIABC [Dietzia sp.]|uniref:PTS fructose transporter subunit IIABC n=1 Tax=Dietzia sp. TaxID=1871616 RepID=UPI002FD9A2BA